MKKFFGLSVIAMAAMTLSACNMSLPTCGEELDNCGRGSAYTEERTARATPKKVVVRAPEPAPVMIETTTQVQEPEPMPVVEPEPVVDTQVMQSAEPQFKQISK